MLVEKMISRTNIVRTSYASSSSDYDPRTVKMLKKFFTEFYDDYYLLCEEVELLRMKEYIDRNEELSVALDVLSPILNDSSLSQSHVLNAHREYCLRVLSSPFGFTLKELIISNLDCILSDLKYYLVSKIYSIAKKSLEGYRLTLERLEIACDHHENILLWEETLSEKDQSSLMGQTEEVS